MSKPLIGITVSQTHQSDRIYHNIPIAYSESIRNAGGLPILIPNDFPLTELPSLCQKLDGVLFSGGGDIDVKHFNGQPHPSISGVSKDRDELELALFHAARNSNLPIFGICRGMQLINVAMGGSLYTHIPDQFTTRIEHSTPALKGRDHIAHNVILDKDNLLHEIIKADTIPVNSFHHQAVKELAPGLKVTAHATDGLIEGVEIPGSTFQVLAVQWHPECIQNFEVQRALFAAFVSACQA